MPAYEVSNHARSGAESRHNLIYWRYGDYVGIGPGAHGRITVDGQRRATEAFANPERWLMGVASSGAEKRAVLLSGQDQAVEYLLMGLRISEGISLARFERLAGHPPDQDKIAHLVEIGMAVQEHGQLRATRDGRAVLNAVIRELLPELP